MLETLRRLGVTSSFSHPRVSNDNAYAESLFRTCKYRPDYPVNGFAPLDDARAWVLSFSRWYNTEHKHSGLKFTTPEQRHTGEATVILEHRQQVYREAKERHPNRWSGEIRSWELPERAWLNPEKEQSKLDQAAQGEATTMLTNTEGKKRWKRSGPQKWDSGVSVNPEVF